MSIEHFTNAEFDIEQRREEVRSQRENHVYVIQFANDVIKVGRATRPKTRLAEHQRSAERFDTEIAQSWTSAPHLDYMDNEKALIAFCAGQWRRAGKHEYFADGDFAAVVRYAESLSYRQLSPQQLDEAVNAEPPPDPPSITNANIPESYESAWRTWTGFRSDSYPSQLQPQHGNNWYAKFSAAMHDTQQSSGRQLNADDAAVVARCVLAQMPRQEYEDALNHLIVGYWTSLLEEDREDGIRQQLDGIGRELPPGGAR